MRVDAVPPFSTPHISPWKGRFHEMDITRRTGITAHTCQILGRAWLWFLVDDEPTREAMRKQLPTMEPNVRACYEEFFATFDQGLI